MSKSELDFTWIFKDHQKRDISKAQELFPIEIARTARKFQSQIPGYRPTPLVSLNALAKKLGVGGIYVKDESKRLGLNSFKVGGGSFALFRFLQKRLNMSDDELTFAYLTSDEAREKIGDITFASATDGNHGRGVAWAAQQLGHKCVIYVHKDTSQARIDAIAMFGAKVVVVDGNYDDAVRQCAVDAKKNNWEIISDTSWDGYEEVPAWIMQGYTTMLLEAQEQFAGMGITRPTHIFVQAGVGALAASVIGFYSALFADNPPVFTVVEPDQAACILKSIEKADNKPHSVKGDLATICAGLACGDPSPLAWEVLNNCADLFLSVPDYTAARGMRIQAAPFEDDQRIIAGESGAVTLGAFYALMREKGAEEIVERLKLDENSKVLFINTEGDTDPASYRRIVWEGEKATAAEFAGITD